MDARLIARAVLSRCAAPGLDREAIVGDLEEEYRDLVARRGSRDARHWYLIQVARSAGPLAMSRLRGDDLPRRAGSILLGWFGAATAFVILAAGSIALFQTLPAPEGLRALIYLGTAFSSAALGGAIARRIRGGRHGADAVALAALLSLSIAAIFLATPEYEPAAMWGIWIAVLSAGAVTGTGLAPNDPRGAPEAS